MISVHSMKITEVLPPQELFLVMKQIQFPIIIKIKESDISNTTYIIHQIQLLKIILLRTIFINDICFRSGDTAWLIRSPIKFHHTKDQFFYYITDKLLIFGIDNQFVSFLFCVIYIHKETNDILCYNFTQQHKDWNITSIVK